MNEAYEKGYHQIKWYNGYVKKNILPDEAMDGAVAVYGLEHNVQAFLDETNPREAFKKWLNRWLDWENSHPSRILYFIGTDVGKGIVPMEKERRLFRDVVGWCFQDVAKQAKRVDVIWYGLNERLK